MNSVLRGHFVSLAGFEPRRFEICKKSAKVPVSRKPLCAVFLAIFSIIHFCQKSSEIKYNIGIFGATAEAALIG